MSGVNKAIAKSFVQEVINGGDLSAVDKYMAADIKDHTPMPGIPEGPEGFKELLTMLRGAFPDMHSSLDHVIAEDDKVAMFGTFTGTHKGEFMGVPATGKQVSVNEFHLVRMQDGKMVEHWGVEDNMAMMTQLGVVELPGP